MIKQRHNWFSYLIIFSLVLLPLQYGQAMQMDSMMMAQDVQGQDVNSASEHQHHSDEQQLSASNNVCDAEKNCCDHHQCGKCQVDVQAISLQTTHKQQRHILSSAISFSEFINNPDLRPPRA